MLTTQPDIHDVIAAMRALEKRTWLTHTEKEALNQARLKVAFWVCRQKGVFTSWNRLCRAMGIRPDAIRPTYERMFGSMNPNEPAP